ncbi:TetR/AcrR family transcriptional regulator [Pseudarthrobacter equi]|nr:TetR/AcrR family transcriptional regulator [Pseudarthrobacter equi]
MPPPTTVKPIQEEGGHQLANQRQEKREPVLQAAQAVFVTNGYHGSSMEDIARTARISKPVLYQYFPSKRELYIELLDLNLRTLTDVLNESTRSTKHNKERVHDAIRAYYGYVARDDGAYRLVFESGLSNDPDVSVRLAAFRADFAAAITQIISEDAQLPLVEAELLGRGLTGLAQVSARFWIEATAEQGRAGLSLDRATELIYRFAWRGISRFPKDT